MGSNGQTENDLGASDYLASGRLAAVVPVAGGCDRAAVRVRQGLSSFICDVRNRSWRRSFYHGEQRLDRHVCDPDRWRRSGVLVCARPNLAIHPLAASATGAYHWECLLTRVEIPTAAELDFRRPMTKGELALPEYRVIRNQQLG